MGTRRRFSSALKPRSSNSRVVFVMEERVARVAQRWIQDYCFRALCECYRARDSDKYDTNLRAFKAVVDDDNQLEEDQQTKRTICCFLSRIMDGKNLDVRYDPNDRVTPLMSALTVWECLKNTVPDTELYENITNLLYVQAVGVCLEKSMQQRAKETLQWLQRETALPEKLQQKLATVVSKKDIYDQLLISFSYTRLHESIYKFLDLFLEEHPSDFLLKSATKVVQAHQEETGQTQSDLEDDTLDTSKNEKTGWSETTTASSKPNMRPKKKLFTKRPAAPWKPESAEKHPGPRRKATELKVSRVSRVSFKGPSPKHSEVSKKPQVKRKWTYEEDRNLKAGVKIHGEGKWAKIREEFHFENRTNVMLKDRWRTLKKQWTV